MLARADDGDVENRVNLPLLGSLSKKIKSKNKNNNKLEKHGYEDGIGIGIRIQHCRLRGPLVSPVALYLIGGEVSEVVVKGGKGRRRE